MLHAILEERLLKAVLAVLPDAEAGLVKVRPCPDAKFGDYQASALMALAKQRRGNPRQLAAQVLERLDVADLCGSVDVAGAGFLNFRLRPEAIADVLRGAVRGEHSFFRLTGAPRTVVVDFSSPNIAKPMHVGHIRSTILGDCLARSLRLLGHRVITDNHLGDWGTQFGKLIVGWKRHLDAAALERDALAEMERLYRLTNAACEADPAVLEEARQELVRLQNGDAGNLELWRRMLELSWHQFETIYGRLGVTFDYTYGESFYNPRLKAVWEELAARGLTRLSDGAQVVFFDEVPELAAHPTIIRKSDGAANYATTDLATLAYRLETWNPNEIVYVTDGRQQLHFKQIFEVFRRWHPEVGGRLRLAHVWFGSILGEDGKPFKTRAGDTVKLEDLLDEAEERARKVVAEKNPELGTAEQAEVARMVGLGAVKYADLLPNRQSDYVFSWDRMLALSGNTAPYLQYAHARIRSIFRKREAEGGDVADWAGEAGQRLVLEAPEERQLGRHLLDFGRVLEAVADEYRPNYLCNYLYELAGHYTAFYEACPVLRAEPARRASRLALCDLSARVLKLGLGVLGIEVPARM